MTSVFYSVVSDTAKYSQGGSYLDLDDRPDLSVYAQKDTLSEYPKITSLDSVAFTGNYLDLSGRPDLSEVLESDTLNVYVMSDSLSSYTLTSIFQALHLAMTMLISITAQIFPSMRHWIHSLLTYHLILCNPL